MGHPQTKPIGVGGAVSPNEANGVAPNEPNGYLGMMGRENGQIARETVCPNEPIGPL
jgi:hypothetical protein